MLKRFTIILSFLLVQFSLLAQTEQRPKIGIALSGGAAHGLAHIGVLKYLEEIGFNIDFITGTSMGSVVGGLYAMGYDSDDLRLIANSQDWTILMSNHTPLPEIAPIEKAHHERIPLSIYWKDDAFQLPPGLIRGQKLDIILSHLYSPASTLAHFDELPIPFRCVAIDVEDGSIDVFEDGYLGDAIRASMAIPSVFEPKEFQGRLYVDGGLIRNFPVEENFAMGADHVIGVYVGGVKEERDDLTSMFDILTQSTSLPGILDSERQANLADIVIRPKVKEMGKFDFDNADAFIKLGYDAAQAQHDELLALLSKVGNHMVKTEVKKLSHANGVYIESVDIEERDPILKTMISNRLKIEDGSIISLQDISEGLSYVYGTKNFQKASYSFTKEEGKTHLNIETEPIDPYTLGVSLNRFKHYNAAFIVNAEARSILGKASNFRMDVRISENPGMQGQYYIRFPSAPSLLFNIKAKYEEFDLPFFNGNVVDRLYTYNEADISIGLFREWRNKFLFSIEYIYTFDKLDPQVFNDNDFQKYQVERNNLKTQVEYNTLDRQVFANTGTYYKLGLNYSFNNRRDRVNRSTATDFLTFREDENYFSVDFHFQHYAKTFSKFCSEFEVRGRWNSGKSFLDHYRIGGPIQTKDNVYGFLGIDDAELIMANHISLRYGLRLHISSISYITPSIQYLYGQDYLSFAYNTEENIDLLSYGVVLGIRSPIGPLTLDIGYAGRRDRAIINFGIGYRHVL